MVWTLEVLFKRESKALIDQAFVQDESTPLMWAIKAANLETLRSQLEKGASIDVHRLLGNPQIWFAVDTPLLLAAKTNQQIFELLAIYGADVDGRSLGGTHRCPSCLHSHSDT
jgi:ankyrin repeat protein